MFCKRKFFAKYEYNNIRCFLVSSSSKCGICEKFSLLDGKVFPAIYAFPDYKSIKTILFALSGRFATSVKCMVLTVTMSIRNFLYAAFTVLSLTLGPGALMNGCATASGPDAAEGALPAGGRETWPRVAFTWDGGILSQAVRAFGEENGGGIVLINGIGALAAPELDVNRAPYSSVIARLAEGAKCRYADCGWYYLIYPAGYEVLLDLSLSGMLPARYQQVAAALSLGEGVALFNAFALLSQSLDLAILADNIVAESRCGELTLDKMPLPAILEGVLQSARIPPGAFSIESGAGYLFFRSPVNQGPADRLLGEADLSLAARELLDREMSLYLPAMSAEPDQTVFRGTAVPLGSVLETLSAQTGVSVRAEESLKDFPVNPCVLPGLPVRTAMNLLIRQWPVAGIGFEVQEGEIRIRRR
jgi:hypothetical protein